MKGAVDSIETFGLVDGPGIRTVVYDVSIVIIQKCGLKVNKIILL